MEDKFSQLTPLVKKYREEMESIHTRRKLWDDTTKNLIKTALQTFRACWEFSFR